MTSNGGSHAISSGNVEERLMVCKEDIHEILNCNS